MSRVIISIQHGDPRKLKYLRKEVGTLHRGTVLAAVEEMLTDPEAHRIGFKPKPTFGRRTPVKRGDEEEQTVQALDELVGAAT
jgi:hypothetical protein